MAPTPSSSTTRVRCVGGGQGCPQGGGTSPSHFPIPRCPQDSLLASPIILDLAILTELCQRVTFCTEADPEFQGFHSVLSIVAFLCKAPLVPEGTPVVNALFRQRSCIENILRYPGVAVLMGATSRLPRGGTRALQRCWCLMPNTSESPCLWVPSTHAWGVQSQLGPGVPNAGGWCWCSVPPVGPSSRPPWVTVPNANMSWCVMPKGDDGPSA